MAVGTWTDPRTWVDGETPTGAQFNTQIRDNLNYLKGTPTFDGNVSVSGTVNANTVNAGGDMNVGDDLTVVGDATLATLAVSGNVNLGDAPADIVDVKGTIVGAPLKTYTETRTDPAIAANALTLDCSVGTYFKVALIANVTISIANPPAAGRALGLTIIFVCDGTIRTITWPSSVKWPNNLAPTMTGPAGKRDIVTVITDDGGVTWFGIVAGQNY